jgi:hypothetical protein
VRTLRNAATALLLAATVVVAGAPAALAAPTNAPGIEWRTYGTTTLQAGSSASICATDGRVQQGQTLRVSRWKADGWVPVRTFGAGEFRYGWWCVSVVPSELLGKPGSISLRATVLSAAKKPLSDARVKLKLVRQPGYVSPQPVSEFTTTTSKKRTVPVIVTAAVGQRVDLQRKSGKKWKTVAHVRAPRTGQSATVALPVPAKAGMGTYRVVGTATTWYSKYVSGTFTLHQTDTVKYRSYIAKARKYIAAYCPKTPIYIDTPTVAGPGRYGLVGHAIWSTSSYAGANTLTTTIELRSGLPAAQLRSVALHECAHVLQARANVVGRYDVEQQRAAKLYPGTADEGQADCMSYQRTRDARYFGYVSGCTKAQLTDAKRMWKAYGKKYQAASYHWEN